jgi:MurNAc alpha-1-phosphate uridylyltransferase
MNAAGPRRAMVLAAGLGLRLRPITENIPKPLVPLAGRTLLDRALDALDAAGVEAAVVNSHYLGAMIEAHLAGRARPRIVLSAEEELLETGGGVARALPHLGAAPFYVINADIAWTDGATPALARLADAWRDEAMDALLLLHPVDDATGYDGSGDFFLRDEGALERRGDAARAPYVFTGVQILHPRLFVDAPDGPFSLTVLYDRARETGRLAGIVHDGDWHHIGTPAGLAEASARLEAGADGD